MPIKQQFINFSFSPSPSPRKLLLYFLSVMILTTAKYLTYVESYSICPFVAGLFLLA